MWGLFCSFFCLFWDHKTDLTYIVYVIFCLFWDHKTDLTYIFYVIELKTYMYDVYF